MFPRRYYPGVMFAPRYFPESAGEVTAAGGFVRATAGGAPKVGAGGAGAAKVAAAPGGSAKVAATPGGGDARG